MSKISEGTDVHRMYKLLKSGKFTWDDLSLIQILEMYKAYGTHDDLFPPNFPDQMMDYFKECDKCDSINDDKVRRYVFKW